VRHARWRARIRDRRGQGGQQTQVAVGAWNKIAPPSELAWGRSKVAIRGRSARSENRAVCAIVGLFNAIASVWENAV
jgi:hypothetical protein